MLRMKVTTHAMRCIDKAHGIDNYILNTNVALLPGLGEKIRGQMLAVIELKERVEKETELVAAAQEFAASGTLLPPPQGYELFDVEEEANPHVPPSRRGGWLPSNVHKRRVIQRLKRERAEREKRVATTATA